MNKNTLSAYKNLTCKQNVSFRVIDQKTGRVVQEHIGHNSATNSLLFGIAHHLIGDFLPNETLGLHPSYPLLANYVPRYISLGTMGLINQNQDSHGLPAGIGDSIPDSTDPEFIRLRDEMNAAKNRLDAAKQAVADDCPYWPACDACRDCENCATRIGAKKQEVEDAQAAYTEAYDAFMNYNEELRFVEYIEKRPGYGADGYDANENNHRKYFGLGYAYSSYDVTEHYEYGDMVMYKGILYKCILNTATPSGPFNPNNWEPMEDIAQPSLGTTIQLELISPTFPRESISYRDIVPEYQAELPKTIDVVFSAMISTGALKQFRPEGQDYIFITEAGLWSKRDWEDSGENGLLAGYRIVPPNDDNWDMTVPANRELLKKQILKVGKNQVVQVVWKIQIGSVDKFEQDQPEYNDTKLEIYLKDQLDRMITGANLRVTYDANGHQVAIDARSGDPLDWTTNESKFTAYAHNGLYYLYEQSPAPGCASSDPIYFSVIDGTTTKLSGPGEITDNDIYMSNQVYTLMQFAVVSEDDSIISGASIKVTADAQGQVIAEDAITHQPLTWTTTSDIHSAYLLDGTYYIHEVSAPAGYVISDPIAVSAYAGELTKTSQTGTITGHLINMLNITRGFVYLTSNGFDTIDPIIFDGEATNPSMRHRVFAGPEPTSGYDYYYYTYENGELTPHEFSAENITLLTGYGAVCETAYRDSETGFDVVSDTPIYFGYLRYDLEDHSTLDIMGYYYCESLLGFKDDTNFENTVDHCSGAYTGYPSGLDLSQWDASNVTSLRMDGTGGYDWFVGFENTQNVTSLQSVFQFVGTGYYKGWESWDTSNVTDLGYAFMQSDSSYESYYGSTIDAHTWDTSSVIHMEYVFSHADNSIQYINIDGWDVSNVTDMSHMFADGYAESSDDYVSDLHIDTDLSDWDVSNVEYMSYMFNGFSGYATDTGFNSLEQLADWDVSSVVSFAYMFHNFVIHQEEPNPDVTDFSVLTNWEAKFIDHVDQIDFTCMLPAGFNEDSPLLPNWSGYFDNEGTYHPEGHAPDFVYLTDTGLATLDTMFRTNGSNQNLVKQVFVDDQTEQLYWKDWGQSGYSPQYISGLTLDDFTVSCQTAKLVNNVETVTPYYPMLVNNDTESGYYGYYYCAADLGFKDESNFRQLVDIGTKYAATEHQGDIHMMRICAWDVSNLSTLGPLSGYMHCSLDLTAIDITQLTSLSHTFADLHNLTDSIPPIIYGIEYMDTSNITNMSYAFAGATATGYLGQVVENWDTSSVTTFAHMFDGTGVVRPEGIGIFGPEWDTSSATDMSYMFANTNTEFNTNAPWDVSNVTTMAHMFEGWGTELDVHPGYFYADEWNVSNVMDFSYMFANTGGSYGEIDSWDDILYATGHIDEINFDHMFYNVDRENLPDWDGTFDEYGTFHPRQPEPPSDNVYITNQGISQLSEASPSKFLRIEKEGNDYVSYEIGYGDAASRKHVMGQDNYIPYNTIESFLQGATVIQTNDNSAPVYLHNGFYYCEKQIEFYDDTNFKAIVNAIVNYYMHNNISFRNWDAHNLVDIHNVLLVPDSEYPGHYLEISRVDLTFRNANNLENVSYVLPYSGDRIIGLETWDVSNVTSLAHLSSYNDDTNAKVNVQSYLNLSTWDTSNVTDMSYAFSGEYSDNNNRPFNITGWDVSNVTDMSYMFAAQTGYASYDRYDYVIADFNNWDVSNVTNMSHMFENSLACYYDSSDPSAINDYVDCYMFDQLSGWDVSNVTDMSYMFRYAGIKYSDVANWDVSSVTNMSHMFDYSNDGDYEGYSYPPIWQLPPLGSETCGDITPLATWDISSVTNMSYMFANSGYYGIGSIAPLAAWDMSNVTDMSYMFYNGYFDENELAALANWSTSSATNMSYMFSTNAIGNTLPVLNWDLSNVVSLAGLFSSNRNLSDISNLSSWNVSNVTDISAMFADTNITSAPLSSWDVSNVTNMGSLFARTGLANTSDIAGWDVSSVTNMYGLFRRDYSGSGLHTTISLPNWNVSSVTDMSHMFEHNARGIDLSTISNWDVSSLTNLDYMFNCNNANINYSPLDNWDSYFGNKIDQMSFNHVFGYKTSSEHTANAAQLPDWYGVFDSYGTFWPNKFPATVSITQNDPIYTSATEADIKAACTFVIQGVDHWGVQRNLTTDDFSILPAGPYTVGTNTFQLVYQHVPYQFTLVISAEYTSN